MVKEKKVLIFLFAILALLLFSFLSLKVRNIIVERTTVSIYLVKNENGNIYLIPVYRKIENYKKIESKIKKTLEELIKGPNELEKKENIFSCLNENTKIIDLKLEDGILNINFTKEVEEGGGTQTMETRIAQIVYTATQFPEIEKVRFLIEGKTINYFSGEGITIVEKPIGREDLNELEIKLYKKEAE